MARNLLILICSIALLFTLVLVQSCEEVGVDETKSPVWLHIEAVWWSSEYADALSEIAFVDVCDHEEDTDTGTTSCTYWDETLLISMTTLTVDPNGVGGSSAYMDIHILHYRISFTRSDGGINVPASFDIYCDLYCPYGQTVEHTFKLLHANQKLDPPLVWLNGIESNGYDPETGEGIIVAVAHINIWGKDNSGNNIEAETRIPVQFADWGDD
ncbi:hypothetical protein JXQ70_03920 [bacterium]|nr:hypothetical protein [bacterium]